MDGTEAHHIKPSKPSSERQRSHVFFHMWKLDLKDKHIHKYIHDHIYHVYIQNMFVIMGLFVGT
jgi:hypothetical protein